MPSPTISTLLFAVASFAGKVSAATCPCGYTINSTTSEHHAIFTELIESDFLHTENLTTDRAWIPQAYNVTPAAGRGPYGKASQVENVITNPIPNPWDWSGAGKKGVDPGLQLWVKQDLIEHPDNRTERMVPMAEIVSSRTDILYGSFRIGMKTTGVSGTCGAFFFYLDDASEIDMEFLSHQQDSSSSNSTVNLVLQSAQSAEVGYVNPSSSDFDKHALAFRPDEGYHEYRFDWLPNRVYFYADGVLLSTIRDNVPNAAGKIHVSQWSNGNPGWSAGPPEEDAVLTISYVKAYFNSSDAGVAGRSLSGCDDGGDGGGVCQVPDQMVAPEPTGPEGNRTGHTTFFGNESVISGTVNEPKRGSGDVLSVGDVLFYLLLCGLISLIISS